MESAKVPEDRKGGIEVGGRGVWCGSFLSPSFNTRDSLVYNYL